ncbi:hypothetical protein V6N13_138021 [Hibiscus sabdariffa]|uniref:Rho-GAP domain-containing protein n=1 Tax=Hibiscus sabdariffa TaxID=183260 RepID=A0ABR2QCA3_9ROSI
MTGLFRSKSCGLVGIREFSRAPPTPFFHRTKTTHVFESNEEEEKEEKRFDEDEEEEEEQGNGFYGDSIATTAAFGIGGRQNSNPMPKDNNQLLDVLAAVLRKSLVTCSVDTGDVSSMDISMPTEVKHVSHVTFDRFNGFLGLPTDLEPDVPRRVPSASASVFGVSAKSMQCSYDDRGNSAWFRELPSGVLDSLTPEQVMHCNTEEDCIELTKLLPSTEAALLDWSINLMADVAQHEQYNKMNARNIAMVFAPNMTQMADPLTTLIHAVQVMNFLKTLILMTLRGREKSAAEGRFLPSCSGSPTGITGIHSETINSEVPDHQALDACPSKEPATAKFLRSATLSRLECGPDYKLWSFQESDREEEFESISGNSTPNVHEIETIEIECRGGYNIRTGLV